MNYYAHTAEYDQGNPLSETSWQPLAAHLRNTAALARCCASRMRKLPPFLRILRNTAALARCCATPLALADEAELAGLLHDCVKDSLAIGTGN